LDDALSPVTPPKQQQQQPQNSEKLPVASLVSPSPPPNIKKTSLEETILTADLSLPSNSSPLSSCCQSDLTVSSPGSTAVNSEEDLSASLSPKLKVNKHMVKPKPRVSTISSSNKKIRPLSTSSRLLKPTAAQKGSSGPPSSTTSPPKTKNVTSAAEASRLAQERVRQHKRQEQAKERAAAQNAGNSRNLKWTAEQGHLRAQARVYIRQHQQATSPVRPTTKASTTPQAPSSPLVRPPPKRSSRPVTVPQGPQLSTSVRAASQRQKRLEQEQQKAQQHKNKTIGGMGSRQWHPTVPQGPKFTLDRKYGDKTVTTATTTASTSNKTTSPTCSQKENNGRTTTTKSKSWKPTVPQGPKFVLDQKYGSRSRSRTASPDNTHRSSQAVSPSPPPRRRSNATPNTRGEWKPTVPQAPQFALDRKYGSKQHI